MIVSTQTMPIAGKIGEAQAVHLLAQAGFEAYDLTLNVIEGNPIFEENYKEYLASLKAEADSAGITCNQSHAPFSSRREDVPKNAHYNEHIFDWLVRSLEAAAYLGAKNIVVHPINYMTYRGNETYLKDMNMDFYRSLAPHAKRVGIRIAIENTGQMDKRRGIFVDSVCGDVREQIDYLETLGDDCFAACLDLAPSVRPGRRPSPPPPTISGTATTPRPSAARWSGCPFWKPFRRSAIGGISPSSATTSSSSARGNFCPTRRPICISWDGAWQTKSNKNNHK